MDRRSVVELARDMGLSVIELDPTLCDQLADVDGLGPEILAEAERKVASIVLLAGKFGIKVAAIGVHTLPQVKRLRRLGVDFAQGPVIAPALSGGSFLALVARMGLQAVDNEQTAAA